MASLQRPARPAPGGHGTPGRPGSIARCAAQPRSTGRAGRAGRWTASCPGVAQLAAVVPQPTALPRTAR